MSFNLVNVPQHLIVAPPPLPAASGLGDRLLRVAPYAGTAFVGLVFISTGGFGIPLVAAKASTLKASLAGKAGIAKAIAWVNGHGLAAGVTKAVLATAGCYATGEVVSIMVDAGVVMFVGMTETIIGLFEKALGYGVTWGDIGNVASEAIEAAIAFTATSHAADFMVVFGPTAVGTGVIAYVVLKAAWNAYNRQDNTVVNLAGAAGGPPAGPAPPGGPTYPGTQPGNGSIPLRPLQGVACIIRSIDVEVLRQRAITIERL